MSHSISGSASACDAVPIAMTENSARLVTQISGKMAATDTGVLRLRHHLVAAGITVLFPQNSTYVAFRGATGYTFDPATQSIYETERAMFAAIANSSFHTVRSIFGSVRGYLGVSAAIETAAAILAGRPIVVTHPVVPTVDVPDVVRAVLNSQQRHFHVQRLDLLPCRQVRVYVSKVCSCSPPYSLSAKSYAQLAAVVDAHLEGYRD